MTLTLLQNALKRWLPTVGTTVATEYINEAYQALATRYPLNPATVTFPTVVGQVEYSLAPNGAAGTPNTSAFYFKKIRTFLYDSTNGKIPLFTQTTFEQFVTDNPYWQSAGNSQPSEIIFVANDTIMLWPAPPTVVTCSMKVNRSVTDLSAGSDVPTGFPAEYHRVLAIDAGILLCEEFDRPDPLPQLERISYKYHAKLATHFMGDNLLPQMAHRFPTFDYRAQPGVRR